jgi:hypothetical protein
MKWTPDKIIALVLIVGSLTLIAFRIDGEVKSILTMAAGWAFGTSWSERKRKNSGG